MIKKSTVVSVVYSLKNQQGTEIDSSTKEEPFVYLHGYGQTVPGFEANLEGLKLGDSKSFRLEPKDAYGDVDETLRIVVPKANFPKEADLQVGLRFMTKKPDGEQVVFKVIQIKDNDVYLDGNHPLAGETLDFQVEVLEMRDATSEELSHGHVHGEGGHHH